MWRTDAAIHGRSCRWGVSRRDNVDLQSGRLLLIPQGRQKAGLRPRLQWTNSPASGAVANVPAATQAIGILKLLAAQAAPMLAAVIARDLGLPRSSIYHLLAVLYEEGFVVHLPGSADTASASPPSSSARSIPVKSPCAGSPRPRSRAWSPRPATTATEHGSVTPGLTSVAAAVLDHRDYLVAAVALTFDDDVAPDSKARAVLAEHTRRAAHAITKAITGRRRDHRPGC